MTNFWCGTVFLLVCASFFCVPILWLAPAKKTFTSKERLSISFCLCMLIMTGSYGLYSWFGSNEDLVIYLRQDNVAARDRYRQLRPLYARLQRELIKNKLDLQLDLTNVDLILQFATIYSQTQQGILPAQIQELLQAVLKTVPQQAAALNLLAIHFFKSHDYAQAMAYWQQILFALGPKLHTTTVALALQAKIAECRTRMQ